MSSPPRSLCVIRLSAIGDCCHALPVVQAIQSAWPETRITWIIGQVEHSLLEGLAGVDFLVLDKRAGRRGMRELNEKLKARRFDLLLQMQDSLRASRVALMTGCRRRVGFDRRRARDFQWLFTTERIAHRPRQHVMEALFGFAEHLGIERPAAPRWDFPLGAEDLQAAARMAPERPFCVMSPLSSQRRGAFRNWPAERYASVASHVVEQLGGEVLLTGSGTSMEQDYAAVIAAQPGVTDLNGRTTLKQLAALIGLARLVVCPDSGPAHIGAALGTRVVGLYAGSNPDRSGPWGNREFTVNRYPQAVLRSLGKGVDDISFGRRLRAGDVMNEIAVADVIETVERAWALPGRNLQPRSPGSAEAREKTAPQ
ncbi:MAG: glycosyltransferase family 9 protein [Gammaproteobacteria bacterium]|nr:glycosyltransferase family 9 protein [Gammaproteobacteria bacterium]